MITMLLIILAIPLFIWGLHSLSLWLDEAIWARVHRNDMHRRLDAAHRGRWHR